MALLQRSRIIPISLLITTAAFACGRDPQARADTTTSDTAASDSATGEVARQDTTKKDTTVLRDSTGKPIDPPITVRVPPGRPKKDSLALVSAVRVGNKTAGWPVKGPAPLPGSLLPQKRIVAFYGNPLSKKMGILGALPPDQMLAKLDAVVAEWRKADPTEPVQPALHLIATVAQGAPGRDGKYRLRMDSSLIEQVYGWAHSHGALLFLDIQTGQATVQEELPRLLPFLSRPDVHFGIDPEFHMHHNREGRVPGTKIGSMTAADVNAVVDYLASIVTKYHLPPKVLVVHRFTTNMLQDAEQIRLDPRVQIVINMDGWGQPWLKFDTYARCEVAEPVQFTGFKLFYHNDTRKGDPILSPREVLALRPRPIYIQYQ